jgi:predicted nucleic acid-binding protein
MMANSVFVVTSGWIALLNATDRLHAKANAAWLELANSGHRFVVTDWVIAETGNGLARRLAKQKFADVVTQFLEAPSVEVVNIDRALLIRALRDYASFTDKSWGLVDCASFVIMRERGIAEAFTSDRDFVQAGFKCLLTP